MAVMRNARPLKTTVRLKIAMVNQSIPEVAEDLGSLTCLKGFSSSRPRHELRLSVLITSARVWISKGFVIKKLNSLLSMSSAKPVTAIIGMSGLSGFVFHADPASIYCIINRYCQIPRARHRCGVPFNPMICRDGSISKRSVIFIKSSVESDICINGG